MRSDPIVASLRSLLSPAEPSLACCGLLDGFAAGMHFGALALAYGDAYFAVR